MSPHDELADFGAFYGRTYPLAFRIAYGLVGERAVAEDVTQDAYVAAYRERARYRGSGPPEAWLYRIVVNTARSALRRQRVRFVRPVEPLPDERDPRADGIDGVLDGEIVADGLRRLDPRSRSAVILRYYLDLDYAAIAAILGTSPDNAGVLLCRALARLQSLLVEEPRAGKASPAVAREAVRHG